MLVLGVAAILFWLAEHLETRPNPNLNPNPTLALVLALTLTLTLTRLAELLESLPTSDVLVVLHRLVRQNQHPKPNPTLTNP